MIERHFQKGEDVLLRRRIQEVSVLDCCGNIP
jgi:hypothetical protein